MIDYKCMSQRITGLSAIPCRGWMGMAPYDYGVGLIALQCSDCGRLVVESSKDFLLQQELAADG